VARLDRLARLEEAIVTVEGVEELRTDIVSEMRMGAVVEMDTAVLGQLVGDRHNTDKAIRSGNEEDMADREEKEAVG
jgi:hypothetical protein